MPVLYGYVAIDGLGLKGCIREPSFQKSEQLPFNPLQSPQMSMPKGHVKAQFVSTGLVITLPYPPPYSKIPQLTLSVNLTERSQLHS